MLENFLVYSNSGIGHAPTTGIISECTVDCNVLCRWARWWGLWYGIVIAERISVMQRMRYYSTPMYACRLQWKQIPCECYACEHGSKYNECCFMNTVTTNQSRALTINQLNWLLDEKLHPHLRNSYTPVQEWLCLKMYTVWSLVNKHIWLPF